MDICAAGLEAAYYDRWATVRERIITTGRSKITLECLMGRPRVADPRRRSLLSAEPKLLRTL